MIAWRMAGNVSWGFGRRDFDLEAPFRGRWQESGQSMEAAARLLPWLGLDASLGVGAALGSDTMGALALGSHRRAGGGFGVLLRLLSTRRLSVTARAGFRMFRASGSVPLELLRGADVLNDSIVYDPNDLTYGGRSLGFAPSIAAALGLARAFGLQASAGFDTALLRTDVFDERHTAMHLAAGLSFYVSDLAVLLGGRIERDVRGREGSPVFVVAERPDGMRGYVEGALYYVGRPRLDMGLVVTRLITSNGHGTSLAASIGYFF